MEVNKLGDIGLHTGNLIKEKKKRKVKHDVSPEIKVTDVVWKKKKNKKRRQSNDIMIFLTFSNFFILRRKCV